MLLTENIHYTLLKLVEANPDISQRELAREMGISLGKVNYCLKSLVGKGFVKLENFRRSDNKLAYAYFLTPLGLEEKARITLSFLRIKEAEYEAIRREIGLLRIEANEISAANVDSKLQSSLQ
jgi:EPS-associated MarR family transcriptional regulator